MKISELFESKIEPGWYIVTTKGSIVDGPFLTTRQAREVFKKLNKPAREHLIKQYFDDGTWGGPLHLRESVTTAIPENNLNVVRKKIRELIKDPEQTFRDAMELTNAAYEAAGVEIPKPHMRDGWKQYEDMLAVAVKELSKEKGMDGDWRMS